MRRILSLLILFIPGFLTAQSYRETQHQARLTGQINPKNSGPEFNAFLYSMEAPLPDGTSYKSFLMRQKQAQREKFKSSGQEKSGQSFPIGADTVQVEKSFGMKRYLSNGTAVDVAGGIPNDNTVAISDSGIIIASLNSLIYAYDLKGDSLVFPNAILTLRTLAGGGGINDYYFDPKIIYDRENDRFILVFLKNADPVSNGYVVAFSTSNNPLDPWNTYFLSGNPLGNDRWTDFPAISLVNNELYITGNLIIDTAPTWQEGFDGSIIWQMNALEGYAGADSVDTKLYSDIRYNGRFIRNLHPVQGALGQAEQAFFLSNRNFDLENDTIFILHLEEISPNEKELVVQVSKTDVPYGMPPNGRQTDTDPNDPTGGLQTNDARVLGAILLDDEIQYVANTVNPETGFSSIYHGFIRSLTSDPQVNGRILGDSQLDFGYPNIAFTGNEICDHEVIIGFNYSSPDSFPGIACRYYSNAEVYSNLRVLKTGENYINRLSGTYERWGDYFGLQRWYARPGSVVSTGFYALESRSNGTWISTVMSPDTSRLHLSLATMAGAQPCAASVEATVSGGVSPYTFLWNGSEGSSTKEQVCSGDTLQVIVQDARGCSYSLQYIVDVQAKTGVAYPNPFDTQVQVQFELENDADVTASIYDEAGRLVATILSKKAKKGLNGLQFQLDPLAKGVYFLRVEVDGKAIFTQKLLKAID